MKKPIYIILILSLLIASCGRHVKKLHKEEEVKITREFTGDTSKISIIDTSSLTVKEIIDTSIVKKGFYIEDSLDLTDNFLGDSILVNVIEKDNVRVKNTYNRGTKKLHTSVLALDDTLDIRMNRETIKKDGVTIIGQNGVYKNKVDSGSKAIIDEKQKRNYNGPNWTTILIVGLIVILALFWFFGLPNTKRNDRETKG